MFADEARFGRMNRPRPCWAPIGIRPQVASQLIREYVYLYGAVSPKDGTCVYLITREFPRLCRGGSRSLTYTVVVLRETCDGLRHDVMRGGNKAKSKQLRSRMQQGKHRQMGLFSITSVGHLGEVPMSSWRLLGVSVIGIGEVSLASPSRFERLTH